MSRFTLLKVSRSLQVKRLSVVISKGASQPARVSARSHKYGSAREGAARVRQNAAHATPPHSAFLWGLAFDTLCCASRICAPHVLSVKASYSKDAMSAHAMQLLQGGRQDLCGWHRPHHHSPQHCDRKTVIVAFKQRARRLKVRSAQRADGFAAAYETLLASYTARDIRNPIRAASRPPRYTGATQLSCAALRHMAPLQRAA